MAIKVKLAGVKVGGPVSTLAWLPDVDESGNLSWTQSDTTTPPESQNIKGQDGKDGVDGKDGKDGRDGIDGVDGITPHIGANGDWYIGDEDTGKPSRGEDGADGVDGQDGYTPQRGVDYWTDEDKVAIIADVEKTQWSNCMLQAFGDSQTENNSKKTIPWNYLLYRRGFVKSPGNMAASTSGYSIAVNASSMGSILTQIQSHQAQYPQLICIMAGVNDVWFDSPLGTIDSNDNTTVCGALNAICEYIYDAAPKSTVVFITPTEQNGENCQEPSENNHLTVRLVRQAIIDVATKYGLPVFDAHNMLGIYPKIQKNANLYTKDRNGNVDGLHLGDAGQEKLAKALADFLASVPIYPDAEAESKYFPAINSYGGRALLYSGCLSSAISKTYACVLLENVVELSIDGNSYNEIFCLPNKNASKNVAIGWFGFRQQDGTFIAISPAYLNNPTSLTDLRGDKWTFSANLSPSQNQHDLWAAPSAKPSIIKVALDGTVGKFYFDNTLMYEVQNANCISYIFSSGRVNGLRGITITMLEDSEE